MWRKVTKHIDSEKLIIPGSRILIAVSGGADSVALLRVMTKLAKKYTLSLVAAHFNHRWRGDESWQDENYVTHLCKAMDVPLTIGQGSVRPAKAKQSENAARIERYSFLKQAANRQAAQRIALGHNADDQAETVLMNILRGSGISGLKGILPLKDDLFIRPLLGITRKEILAFLAKEKLSYKEDSSNRDEIYLRNRVRHLLLPQLSQHYSPKVKQHLLNLASVARDEDDFLDHEAERYWKGCSLDNRLSLVLTGFLGLHIAVQRRVLRKLMVRIISPHRETVFNQVEPIIQFLGGKNTRRIISLGRQWQLRVSAQDIHISPRSSHPAGELMPTASYCYSLEMSGETIIEEINLILRLRLIDKMDYDDNLQSKDCLYLDYDKLHLPLHARARLPGDKVVLSGMKGRKSLKKFFNEQNFSPSWRLFAPIIVDGESIVAVAPHRICDRVKITAQTTRILKLWFEKTKIGI